MIKVGLNECALIEVDPFPDLPLDNVLWGSPFYN